MKTIFDPKKWKSLLFMLIIFANGEFSYAQSELYGVQSNAGNYEFVSYNTITGAPTVLANFEAFADYADFLQQRSWYEQALAQGQDIAGFAQGLQQAGYATDPQYASKIIRLAEQIKHQHRDGDHG